MPDNGIQTMCKSQANPCFPTIFFVYRSFSRKTTSHVRLHVLPASRRSECSGGRGGVDRRRLDERGRGVTPERVRGQCGNHPQGPRRMHADGCMHRRFRSPSNISVGDRNIRIPESTRKFPLCRILSPNPFILRGRRRPSMILYNTKLQEVTPPTNKISCTKIWYFD